MMARNLISKLTFISRGPSLLRTAPLHRLRLRPITSLPGHRQLPIGPSGGGAAALRCFSTRLATSSLNDPSRNLSNRPPKETILLDGCDFEHWLVVLEDPDPNMTRDEIIDSYIKTLAQVVGSEDEARMKIYSVSTRCYFAFGALVSEELSYKIKALPKVRWVLPDSYLDVKNKDYGGEPFIDGKAVPYDPKYHAEWINNQQKVVMKNKQKGRPRSRNVGIQRENMQKFQNMDAPTRPSQGLEQNPMPPRAMPPMPISNLQNAMHPSNMPPMPNRDFNAMPSRDDADMGGGLRRVYQNQMPNPQSSYVPSRDQASNPTGQGYQGSGQGHQGGMLGSPVYQGSGQGYQGGVAGNQGGSPGHQGGVHGYQGGGSDYQGGDRGYQGGGSAYQGGSPGYRGGMPAGSVYQGGGQGYQGGGPGHHGGNHGYHGGGPAYQGGSSDYQSGGFGYQGGSPSYPPGGSSYQGGGGPAYQGRDTPGRD